MFTRVIRGRVASANKPYLRNSWERWQDVLAESGRGWLGSTAGVSRRGEFRGAMRFETEEQLREIDDLTDDLWWDETRRYLWDLEHLESSAVDVLHTGGEAYAGFVQFIQGRAHNVEEVRALNRGMEAVLQVHRPDLLGSYVCWHAGGTFSKVVYFSSEAEARLRESEEFPHGLEGLFNELMHVIDDLSFVDLPDPWLMAPAPERIDRAAFFKLASGGST